MCVLLSGEQLRPPSAPSPSLGLVNDIWLRAFKRSIPLMSGDLIFKLPLENRRCQSCDHFSAVKHLILSLLHFAEAIQLGAPPPPLPPLPLSPSRVPLAAKEVINSLQSAACTINTCIADPDQTYCCRAGSRLDERLPCAVI